MCLRCYSTHCAREERGAGKAVSETENLIRVCEGFIYTSQLRRFLLNHPLLVIELGFSLELDPCAPYGFDVEQTLPCRYWFAEKLRQLDRSLLQALLHATVAALQQEIPGLGETVAFDVKHIYGWVKENNERYLRLSRPALPLSLAVSREDRSHL